jgi:hypothetical protein
VLPTISDLTLGTDQDTAIASPLTFTLGNDACVLSFAAVEITVNKAIDPNFRPTIGAVDPWSLALLAGLPLLRRRPKPQKGTGP